MNDEIKTFLRESNAIEDVWDKESLANAIKAWEYLIKEDELTLENILKTHEILMEGKLPIEQTGKLRRVPVWIGGREGRPWFVLNELMGQWIHDATDTIDFLAEKLDVDDEIKLDHIAFEAIHPFVDGNGRMGRILMNWQRVKCHLPILVIKESKKMK